MAEKPINTLVQTPGSEDPENENIRCLTTLGHFGFECLPTQLVNKSIQKGFSFNILCVGETGIGKSTLINTLFNTNLKEAKSSHFYSKVGLKVKTYELLERNIPLKLTVVKTVGYGDQINKEASYQPVVDYLDAQFEAYLQEELKIKRSMPDYHDSRIHVCLYFITPTGHSLKSLDLITMKSIDRRVNIIPLIAKADSLSKNDLQRFKNNIMSELSSNGVHIYQFLADDEATAQVNSSGLLPFAVVGSMEEVKVGKRMVKGRHYPWGVLQVENENHCDFVKLRDLLLCTHMEDLKDQTHTQHYECYRSSRLQKLGFSDKGPNNKPVSFQEMYEAKRQEFHDQCQREEEELKQTFMQRVKEKELTFKDAEKELQDKFEHLKRIQQEEILKLEEERRKLEEQIIDFYKMKAASESAQAQVCMNVKKDKDPMFPEISPRGWGQGILSDRVGSRGTRAGCFLCPYEWSCCKKAAEDHAAGSKPDPVPRASERAPIARARPRVTLPFPPLPGVSASLTHSFSPCPPTAPPPPLATSAAGRLPPRSLGLRPSFPAPPPPASPLSSAQA